MNEKQKNILNHFSKNVNLHPDSPAIVDGNTIITYSQLNKKVNAVAFALREHLCDFPQFSRISLKLSHGYHSICGMLSAMKANYTYVPIQLNTPEPWVDKIQKMVGAKKTIDDIFIERTENFSFNENVSFIEPEKENEAYILFTSGSTDLPKGVLQNHHGLQHHVLNYIHEIELCREDGLLLLASYTFDAAVLDVYGALAAGACLYPLSLKQDSLKSIYTFLEKHTITLLHATPSV